MAEVRCRAPERPSEQPVQVGAVAVDRERVQLGQQLARPRGLRDRLQREQELQIVERAPGVRVDRRHVAAAQLEPHRQPLARRAEPERVVAGQLELEDPLAGRHRDRWAGLARPGAQRLGGLHRPATPWPRRRSRDTGARSRGRSRSPATSTWRTAARAAARARRAGTPTDLRPARPGRTARGRAEWDSRRREGARRTGRCVRARTRDGEALSAPDREDGGSLARSAASGARRNRSSSWDGALIEDCHHASEHERPRPQPLRVHPRLAEDLDAELLIDDDRDDRHHERASRPDAGAARARRRGGFRSPG